MTQEEKDLLIKEFCARGYSKLKCYAPDDEYGNVGILYSIDPFEKDEPNVWIQYPKGNIVAKFISEVKPYLRPPSSMTNKEIANTIKYVFKTDNVIYTSKENEGIGFYIVLKNKIQIKIDEFKIKLGEYGISNIDSLNANHFDYRGLIPRGLALEAPEGMYN